MVEPPKAVIFDCDGVLVDSEPMSNALMVRNLARHGLAVTVEDTVRMFLGGTIAGVAETVRGMGVDLPDTWVEDFYEELYDELRRGVPPIPGAAMLLDRLDTAGIPYAVTSNGSLEKMEITLGQTGLWARFEGQRFSAHVEGTAKPDPGLFLRAAERLGHPPGACVVVEDSRSGAIAARRAGMRCLALSGHDDAALVAEGALVVASLTEVSERIGL